MRAGGLAAILLALAAPASTAEPEAALRAANERLAAAAEALAAAREAEDRAAALGLAVRGYEDAVADLRSAVIAVGARDRAIALDLAERREATARLLAALQGLPPEDPGAADLHPQGPLAAARAAALAGHVRPRLEARSAALAGALAERDAARGLQIEGFAALAKGLEHLQAARIVLRAALLAEGSPVEAPDAATAAILRRSDSLTALAEAFGGAGDGDGAAASLLWPVRGTLLRGFRAPDAAGVRQPAIVVGAPPLAVVAAPDDASVRYAGPFLDYGQVVVLRLPNGATMVLAGLAQTTARTGDTVVRGEPIGLLGGRTLAAEEYVMITDADTGAGARQALYILIRGEQGPVDPEPWFAVENG